jgi:hypothetical protein
MLTTKQLRVIHVMRKDADLNDAQYRTVLRSVAGVSSSKDLDQEGFERTMAAMEGYGGDDRCGTYWRDRQAAREGLCGERAFFKIRQLIPHQRYSLESLVWRFSEGRSEDPRCLQPREAWNLIEMLKAVIERDPADAGAFTKGTEAQDEPDLFGGAAAQR